VNPSNEPLTNSLPGPSNPDQGAAEFLGLNLDAFRELVAFADVAEGFTLALVEVNFSSDGDLLVEALQNHEVAQEVQFVVLDFNDRGEFSFLQEVTAALANVSLDPARKPVLLVRGLATAIGVKSDYPSFLNELNFTRDQLALRVPYPIVLFLPDYAVNRLGQYAKDLWTWKSGLFHFRTSQQVIEATQTQLSQPTALPADSRPVKQERIEQLERLLSEQVNNGHPPTHPLKAFIAMALELGDAYRSLSDYEQARQCYHKALGWAEAEQDQIRRADALYGLGQVHRLKVDNKKALARFEQALELYRAVGDRLGEANVLKAIGDVLQFLKRSTEALQNYEQALELYRVVGDRLGEANVLIAIGDVLQFLDRRTEALQNYEQALELYRAVGARLGEANVLKAIGDVLQFLKRSTEALQNYEQALELYRAVGARLGEANVLKAIGDVLQFLKRSTEALQNYEQALELYRAVGARLGEANVLKAIGDVLQFLKRSTEALQNYEQALELYRAVGARLGEANVLKAIGDVLQFLKRSTEALQNYEQALELYRAVGARLGEANVLKELGKMLSKPEEAVRLIQQAQSIYEAIEDRYSQCRNLIVFLAAAQLAAGQKEAAIRSLHRGADLALDTEFQFYREDALKRLREITEDTADS